MHGKSVHTVKHRFDVVYIQYMERRGMKSYSTSIVLPHPVTEGGGDREHGPVFFSVALNFLGVVIGVAVYFPFPSCPPPAKWR